MTGRSEFIEKYFEVCNDLNNRGISVAMMDWRGQGLSARALPRAHKGHIEDFGVFRSDLVKFTDEIAKTHFAGPYILMTHSMGGAPALDLLADGDDRFSCAVLCAPMTRLYDDTIKRTLIRLLAKTISGLGGAHQSIIGVKEHSLEFDGNNLTSDRARHARFRDLQLAAPHAVIRQPTYGWVRAAFACMEDLHKKGRFNNLTTPTLIVSAAKDALIFAPDHLWLCQQSSKMHCVTIPDALHEIMMESDHYRNQYWTAFDQFVAQHAFAPSRH